MNLSEEQSKSELYQLMDDYATHLAQMPREDRYKLRVQMLLMCAVTARQLEDNAAMQEMLRNVQENLLILRRARQRGDSNYIDDLKSSQAVN